MHRISFYWKCKPYMPIVTKNHVSAGIYFLHFKPASDTPWMQTLFIKIRGEIFICLQVDFIFGFSFLKLVHIHIFVFLLYVIQQMRIQMRFTQIRFDNVTVAGQIAQFWNLPKCLRVRHSIFVIYIKFHFEQIICIFTF